MGKRIVMIESPYSGDVEKNEAYARECMLDSLNRGEIPIVTHLLWTQVWDDTVADVRESALQMCKTLRKRIGKAVFYTDLGWSSGMERAKYEAMYSSVIIEERRIHE